MTARTEPRPKYTLPLDEEDRQLVLLALAVLSAEAPGSEAAIRRIATRIDEHDGAFDAFLEARLISLARLRAALGGAS